MPPRPVRSRRTRRLIPALVLAAAAAASACSAGGDDTEPATTTATAEAAPTTPTTEPTDRRLLDDPEAIIDWGDTNFIGDEEKSKAAVRAVARAEQAFIKAGMEPPNPNHPDLLAVFDGAELEARQQLIREDYGDGIRALKAPYILIVRPKATVLLNDTRRQVDYCTTEQTPVYERSTGRVLNDDIASSDAQALMELRGERWMMIGYNPVGDVRTGDSCAP